MGFFSRRDKKKAPPQREASILSPPNLFISAPPPPPRQIAATRGNSNGRERGNQAQYKTTHNVSTTQLTASHHQSSAVVNQHGYLASPQHGNSNPYGSGDLRRFTSSMSNLASQVTAVPSCADPLTAWYGYGTQVVGAFDEVAQRLNNVLTLIDEESLRGNEMDLFACRQAIPEKSTAVVVRDRERTSRSPKRGRGKESREREREIERAKIRSADVAASVVRGNYFSKVELYSNSKLPATLPPFAVHPPTWPLLTLAAQYSLKVYTKPSVPSEAEHHLSPSLLTATKAMTIKSIPMDHMHTIIFAIRGTASFMDWAVNLSTSPASPAHFLDDTGNLCHSGFLNVARRMVKPVAARLREMLREDPGRARYSLMITGHSAGGAVAALLYSHMLSRSKDAQSELNLLTGRFKRVHCVTFGTPPISLLPLTRPPRRDLRNSVFISFVNEGDPVVRADKAYVKSLLELLASPPPSRRGTPWSVPPCTLSLAGRIVVLRSGRPGETKDSATARERLAEGVRANVCDEGDLRGVVWGDPVAHLMSLYAGRIETMAAAATR